MLYMKLLLMKKKNFLKQGCLDLHTLIRSENLANVIYDFLINWRKNMRWHEGQTPTVIHQQGKDKRNGVKDKCVDLQVKEWL